jgi:hypothetical protein
VLSILEDEDDDEYEDELLPNHQLLTTDHLSGGPEMHLGNFT